MGNVHDAWQILFSFSAQVQADWRTLEDEWRLTGEIVCVITKSEILISGQFNISPHYSFWTFMVQNQITVLLRLTIVIWLSGSATYTILWGSAVGYPSDSLAVIGFRVTASALWVLIVGHVDLLLLLSLYFSFTNKMVISRKQVLNLMSRFVYNVFNNNSFFQYYWQFDCCD